MMSPKVTDPRNEMAGQSGEYSKLSATFHKDSPQTAAGSFNFLEFARRRYSVRSFTEVPVEDEKLRYVLDAALSAPSACNNQPWIFIVLRDSNNRERLETVYNRPWFLSAPVIIAACYDTAVSWRRSDGKDYGEVDTAIAIDHLTLAAADAGLGTCWVGAFNVKAARSVLMLPATVEPVAFIPLGYPVHEIPKKARKSFAETVHYEFFGA